MGVLIKGFEMPKDGCKDCVMVERGFVYDICPFLKREVNGNVKRGGKPNGCPLIEVPDTNVGDTISRQAAIDAVLRAEALVRVYGYRYAADAVRELPPVQPEKETAKRVLWTGWKGTRDTRYKCPNCKKPVKNDDVYCHRCGQKLMFPHISFTDYIPGEKQELIVRWDDE